MHEYREGHAKLVDVLKHQRAHIRDWGRGRFLRFYTDALDLKLDDIAFLNIALCSTADNRYPPWMLGQCFEQHTGQLIRALAPNLLVLSGRAIEQFRVEIMRANPRLQIETMLHYAHRKSNEEQAKEHQRIRATLDSLRLQSSNV